MRMPITRSEAEGGIINIRRRRILSGGLISETRKCFGNIGSARFKPVVNQKRIK